MKKLILTVVILTVLSSCKKDDVKTKKSIESEIVDGTWKITSFIDSGNDETSNFSAYNFTFNTDGSVSASNGSNSYSGTWSITDGNSNDDSSDDLDFNIYFNLSNDFEDLNDDWDIESHSSSSLNLIDISGGNGGTDYLKFTKN